MSNIYSKLLTVQQSFKSAKTAYNQFGNFTYRNVESMLDVLKSILAKENMVIIFNEEMQGEGVMVCTCTLIDVESGEKVANKSCVHVDGKYKGMSEAQASGATITYLRKYTLGGLLAVGTEKDPDGMPMDNSDAPMTPYEKIEACKTKTELKALWDSIGENDRKVYQSVFTERKKALK